MEESVLFEKVIIFLQQIGIEIKYGNLAAETCFLPGFLIEKGVIIIDKDKVKFPGDILHEAAHIAVVPAAERNLLNAENIGKRKDAPAEEMMSIAWSYAACCYLKIDPHFVFHEQGYKGGAASIVENFEKGDYFGVPVLEWLGMTTTSKSALQKDTYPVMQKWMRD